MLPEWEEGSLKNTCIVGSEVTNPQVYSIRWIDINSCLGFYNIIIHWSFEKWWFIELHRSTNMTYFITLNQKSHLLILLPTLADRSLSMRNTWSSVSKILSSVTNMVRDQLTSFSYQTMSNKVWISSTISSNACIPNFHLCWSAFCTRPKLIYKYFTPPHSVMQIFRKCLLRCWD